MSRIVAANFDTFDAAQVAANALHAAGVSSDSLHTFFVNPHGAHASYPVGGDRVADPEARGAPYSALGAAALFGILGALVGAALGFTVGGALLFIIGGAGVGAYVGSLVGAMRSLGGNKKGRSYRDAAIDKKHQGHPAGVLLAVHVSPEDEERIAKLLKNSGGKQVERAQGQWRNGQWTDFDPLMSPELIKNGADGRAPL